MNSACRILHSQLFPAEKPTLPPCQVEGKGEVVKYAGKPLFHKLEFAPTDAKGDRGADILFKKNIFHVDKSAIQLHICPVINRYSR